MQRMRVSDEMIKRICRWALACLLVAAWISAGAEGIDVNRSANFSVRYEVDDAPMADVAFSLYRVADVDAAGRYTLAGQFAKLPVNLDGLTSDGMRTLAQTLSGYVGVGGYTADAVKKTDGKGIASFGEVATGLYLVMGETVERGEKRYRPGDAMVSLPSMDDDGQWNYLVTMAAKQDVTALTHVRVIKRWDDAGARDARPESITVALLGDGQVVDTQNLTAATGWQYEWTGLDAGVEWNVAEYPSLENYRVSVSSDGWEFTLTNAYQPTPTPSATPEATPSATPEATPSATPEATPSATPEATPSATPEATTTPAPRSEPSATPAPQTELIGIKNWVDDDNAAGMRPEDIVLTLYANGVATDYKPTWDRKSGNSWSYAFRNLPKLDGAGNVIEYTVKESPVENYRSTQSGTTITNELVPREPRSYIDISGTKSWQNDAEDERPEYVIVRLLRDGEVIEEKTVTAADGWKYSFTHLPTDNGYGHDYTYEVTEKLVSGYYTLISGYDITNVRVPIPETPDNPNEPGQPRIPGQPRTPIVPREPGIPPLPEEDLEELIDIFDYGVPLWGGLLGTGDETPVYPYVFAGIGVAAVAVLLIFGRKKKKKDE